MILAEKTLTIIRSPRKSFALMFDLDDQPGTPGGIFNIHVDRTDLPDLSAPFLPRLLQALQCCPRFRSRRAVTPFVQPSVSFLEFFLLR